MNLPHLIMPTARVPKPIPTAAEARGDRYAPRRRFQDLCATGSQAEFEDLVEQWADPVNVLQTPAALYAAARHERRSLLEYLVGRGSSLFIKAPQEDISYAAARYATSIGDTKVLELLLEYGWDLNIPIFPHPLALA
jgi:hypothetical protein